MSEPSLRPPLVFPHQFYSSHTPPLQHFTGQPLADSSYQVSSPGVSATFTSMTSRGAGLPDPEAAVVPALASAFDSEVTSLEQVTARSTWVCASFRTAILSSSKRDFPLRKQKLGVTIPHGNSRFSTVSSDSYWQALLHLFRWAFHG